MRRGSRTCGCDVALEARGGHRQAAPREVAQEFVVERRRAEQRLELRVRRGIVAEHVEHRRLLVAEQELDRAILRRLESRRARQRRAERLVLGRRQRLQHRPLLEELPLDQLDAREDLEAGLQPVRAHVAHAAPELVDHQLHPQLGRLVLDDEQHLVVAAARPCVGGERLLRGQQPVEAQVARVGQADSRSVTMPGSSARVVMDGGGRGSVEYSRAFGTG